MSLLFDAVIVLAFVLLVWLGVKRGFIKSVMHFGATIIALFISMAFTPTLASWVSTQWIDPWVTGYVTDSIHKILGNVGETVNLSALFADSAENTFAHLLSSFGADTAALSEQFGAMTQASGADVSALAAAIASPVSVMLATIVSFVALFVVSLIVLSLLTLLLDAVFHLPVLKFSNKVLGLAFGVVSGLVVAWILGVVFVKLTDALSPIYPDLFNARTLDNSFILQLFAEHNPIRALFNAIPELK